MNKKPSDTHLLQKQVKIEQLIEEAWKSLHQGEIDTGRTLAQQALEISGTLDENYDIGQAHSLIVLAESSREEGQYAVAIELIRDAQLLYEHLEHDIWLVRGLYISANSYDHLGDHSEALRLHHSQLDIAQRIHDLVHQATALRRIGVLHGKRQQYDRAIEYYEQCLAIYQQTDDKTGLPGVYTNMSEVARSQGDYQTALDFGQRSLALHEEMGLIAPRVFSHSSLAYTYFALGDEERARYHLNQCLVYARQSKRNYPQIFAFQTAATLHQQLKQPSQSIIYLQKALELARQASDRFEEAQCLRLLADAHASSKNFEQAYVYHLEYHALQSDLWQDNTQTRFNALEVIFRTKQAQAEADKQQQLRKQDQQYFEQLTQMKDDVMNTLSHDLKNPLANIGVVLHLLRKHGRVDDERGTHLLSRIDGFVERMSLLITNLLDLARIEMFTSLNLIETDIVSLIRDAYEEFKLIAEAQGIVMTFHTEISELRIRAEPQLLQQVLANLLSNATKYTSHDGKIELNIIQQDHTVVTSVRDTGMGVPADDIPYVFDRFYRVENRSHQEVEGTGLGLAICKSIIKQHGGRIWIESTFGEGTTIYFSLPL